MQSAAQSGLNSNTPQQYHQMSSVARQSLGQCYILQYLHWPFFALLWRFNCIPVTVESYLIHGGVSVLGEQLMTVSWGYNYIGKSFIYWFVRA